MPKIKLKPNVNGVEVGLGNLIDLKFTPGESIEVSDEIAKELMSMGPFESAENIAVDFTVTKEVEE